MHSRVDSAVVLSSLGLFQTDRFLLSLGCVVKWTRGSSIRLVWFGSAQKVRCNSIKGSLRVALVISSLLIMNLYTGRSPMSIQVRTLSTGARFAGDDI